MCSSELCSAICEKRVILPDDVAGLGEAARHKEAFDDVDFLIHGLRQPVGGGGWGATRSQTESAGETECKKKKRERKTEVTSEYKLTHSKMKRKKKRHHAAAEDGGKKKHAVIAGKIPAS